MHWLQLLILRWREWSSSRCQHGSTRSTAFSIYPLPAEVTSEDARTSNPAGVLKVLPLMMLLSNRCWGVKPSRAIASSNAYF
jgi:hypothetical protein